MPWPAGSPLSHAYLSALETSGCVSPRTGWTPRHAALWEGDTLLAAMPLYLKTHSYGEYVFDWAWADAYQRHGLDYYPKWLAAVPFTPVPGQRVPGRDEASRRLLIHAVREEVERSGASSLHILFPDADEAGWMQAAGHGDSPWRAVSLAQHRLPGFRRLPRPSGPAEAQEDPPGTPQGGRGRGGLPHPRWR
jgi:predicted N-acyltransferase